VVHYKLFDSTLKVYKLPTLVHPLSVRSRAIPDADSFYRDIVLSSVSPSASEHAEKLLVLGPVILAPLAISPRGPMGHGKWGSRDALGRPWDLFRHDTPSVKVRRRP
jgi:hypothetical protein